MNGNEFWNRYRHDRDLVDLMCQKNAKKENCKFSAKMSTEYVMQDYVT